MLQIGRYYYAIITRGCNNVVQLESRVNQGLYVVFLLLLYYYVKKKRARHSFIQMA
jgi:hypothetical protein